MSTKLNDALATFISKSISNIEKEDDSIWIEISDGSKIYAGYWRLLKTDGTRFSSFDHNQKYGLQNAFNAVDEVTRAILGQKIKNATYDLLTADLELIFQNQCKLQIFNFTAYEAWEVELTDGTSFLSNYAN